MFSRTFAATVVMIATLTTSVMSAPATATSGQCSTGSMQCCENVKPSNAAGVPDMLAKAGAVVQGVMPNVGMTCSPMTVIGLGSTSCNNQAVCCENNSFNGVVALGCTPINVVL
ncbi:hydrophobin-251 [Desarmillaria tabescens]|uniref:Hydrophobin n=1 Tax=Armillaria tabescens TaxID=1929756 RepID=A0AA39JRD8_ARMTA|nr:hydrophobin-251 [Desarmillaria tabescens]KAK0447398.1 hydrophobin-251 [Desarmillaria tabescens]